jgi:hypothetical protein
MKTFMIATLTAGAFATEIPTISLDLSEAAFKHAHSTQANTDWKTTSNKESSTANSFARRCEVSVNDLGSTPADCPSPTASAHDHHDGSIDAGQIDVTATQFVESAAGSEPAQVNTALADGIEEFDTHKGLDTAYYAKRGEFVLTYNVKDANQNAAETLVFAMIMVDTEAPTIVSPVASHTVEACAGDGTLRCKTGGFSTASASDKYDGTLTGAKFTYTQDTTTSNVAGATIEVNTQAVLGDHAITFTATDFADIFGASNENNVKTETITITNKDTTPPRVYLKNAATGAKTGADYEEAVCGTTAIAGVTSIAQCLQHNMRKVIAFKGYNSDATKCTGCKNSECFTTGAEKCTAVEATKETFECGVTAPADLFDADGKALIAGAFGVDDRQSASTTSNENNEAVLTVAVGTDTFDKTKTGLHDQTFTYTTTATSTAGTDTVSKTRTISLVDTTDPVLKITHLGHADLTVDTATDYHTHNGATIDTAQLSDPLADLHVIQHSAGYVEDVKYITGLTTAGTGWTCEDTCQGSLTTVPFSDANTPGSKAEWFKTGDCTGTVATAFETLVTGDWSIKYTCTDKTNSVTACRKIENKDHAKPIITILEGDNDVYEATKEDNYVDAGATCQDEVDGNISQDVEVSGDVVNLARVGTYQIFYNCKDSAQNEADPATRTVVVEDTLCPTCTITADSKNLDIEASFTFADDFNDATNPTVSCSDELQASITPVATTYATSGCVANVNDHSAPTDCVKGAEFTTEISKTVGTYFIEYVATDSVGNTNAGGNSCKIGTTVGGQDATDYTRTVVVRDTLKPVIKLSLGGSVIKVGPEGASTTADFDSTKYVANPAVAAPVEDQHWKEPSLMAEESSTTAVNGWVMGAVASAVSGLALLGYSLRRGAAPVATSVPV